jgi:hypothetical protein
VFKNWLARKSLEDEEEEERFFNPSLERGAAVLKKKTKETIFDVVLRI